MEMPNYDLEDGAVLGFGLFGCWGMLGKVEMLIGEMEK
jgi:hypothetical protein